MAGSCRWLDRKAGDITLAWSEDQDDEVEKVIQKKMDQGIRFFQASPFDKSAEPRQITRVSDIQGREISVADEDIAKLFTDGKVGIFNKATAKAREMVASAARRITSAAEAARTNTMAVRQPAGG